MCKEGKSDEEEELLQALADEVLKETPLDEGTKNKVKLYCGVKNRPGAETGQGSTAAGQEGGEEGYKYYESALEAMEYNSEEKLSDDESINLAD